MKRNKEFVNQNGQGLVEYALILVLVAIVVIAVLMLLGPKIGNTFSTIDHALTEAPNGMVVTSSYQSDSDADARDNAREAADEFADDALEQEESLLEGADLFSEALFEGSEVMAEYFDEIGDDFSSGLLSDALQAFENDNYEQALELFNTLQQTLASAPEDVQIALALKMTPRIISACSEFSGAVVDPGVIQAAIEAADQLDEPRRTEVLELLEEAKETVEMRNQFIGETTEVLLELFIDPVINELQETGNENLIEKAQEFAEASESCGL